MTSLEIPEASKPVGQNVAETGLFDKLKTVSVEVHEVNFPDDASSVSDESLYMPNFDTTIERSSIHIQAIGVRDELQTHLRSALHNGDELLDKVRGISESLDVANYERDLAVKQKIDAEKRRDEALKNLEKMIKELKTVRQTLIDMTHQRNDALILIKTVEGQVMEKEREIDALSKEGKRAKIRITQLEIEAGELKKRVTSAEAESRQLRIKYEESAKRCEELLGKYEESKANSLELEKKLSESKLNAEQLRQSEGANKQKLIEMQGQLDKANKDIKDAYKHRERAVAEKRDADAALLLAKRDYDSAKINEKKAVDDRDAARNDRDVARNEKHAILHRCQDLENSLADIKRTQVIEREERATLRKQRDEAVKRADVECHYKLETQEHSFKLDLQKHEFQRRIAEAERERDKAIKDLGAGLKGAEEEKEALRKEQAAVIEQVRKDALFEYRETEKKWVETVEKVRLDEKQWRETVESMASERNQRKKSMMENEELLKNTVTKIGKDQERFEQTVEKIDGDEEQMKTTLGDLKRDEAQLKDSVDGLKRQYGQDNSGRPGLAVPSPSRA